MPELTIVASWRVITAMSVSLTRSAPGSLISFDVRLSAMSRTIRPRDFSWSATCCFDSASTSPWAWRPVRSIALKTNVVALMTSRGHQTAGAHEAPQLVRMAGPLLGELLRDLALTHERRERGVHRLHPGLRAGLHDRHDLVGLALADQVADRRGGDEHLARRDAARAVGGRQQRLGDDALQGNRQL